MKQILEKQAKHLEEIKKVIKSDNVIQLNQVSLQAKTDKDLNEDQKQTNDRLDKINKTLEDGLKKESPKSLNSNVVKLFKEVEKQTKVFKKFTPEQAQRVTDKAMRVPQFKQIGERFEGLVKGFKDFFSLKGFLNKTGIISKDSDGILATAVNKRAARMEYVEDRMKMDRDKLWNLRGGSKLDESLKRGEISQEEFNKKRKELEDGMRESFANIFNDAQDIMRKMRKNEADIKRMEEGGFTEEQVKRSGVYGVREDLAKKLSERDTRFKQPKEEISTVKKDSIKSSIDDEKRSMAEAASFSDETQIEALRMQERQVGLLEKIAENTEYLKNLGGGGGGMARREGGEEGEDSGFGGLGAAAAGLLAKGKTIGKAVLRGGKAVGKAVLRGGKAILQGGRALGQGIMNVARAPLTGVAKFAAPLAAGLSVGEGISDLAEGKRVEELSQIVPEGWSKLNPFSWAMRGGMYAGEKINKGYGAVSEALGGSGTLGGDVYEGVQGVKGFGQRIGEKVRGFAGEVKDSWNRGTGGTMAAQEMDAEVFKRTEAEGVEFGSKRANEIREEVRKEILAKDPNAFRLADQIVGSRTSVNENQTSGQGMVTTEQTTAEGITSKKSLFGSEFLGSLISKKGLQTGSFSGASSEQKSIESTTDSMMSSADNTTSKFRELFGERISGGLFGKDKYRVSAGDGIDTEISKDQYMKMQALVAKGDPESQKQASAMLEDIKKKSAEAKMFEGAYDISKSPEEMVTPMTERAPSGPSLFSRFKSMFAPKTALPGTTAAEMLTTPAPSKAAAPAPAIIPVKAAAVAPASATPALDASANNVKLADRAAQQKPQPVIVSAPTTNVANNKQNVVVPTPIRNQDSSLGSYVNKRAVFI